MMKKNLFKQKFELELRLNDLKVERISGYLSSNYEWWVTIETLRSLGLSEGDVLGVVNNFGSCYHEDEKVSYVNLANLNKADLYEITNLIHFKKELWKQAV